MPRQLLVEHLVDRLPIIPSRRAKQLNLQIAVDRRVQPDPDAASIVDMAHSAAMRRTTSSAVNIDAICRHLDTQVRKLRNCRC